MVLHAYNIILYSKESYLGKTVAVIVSQKSMFMMVMSNLLSTNVVVNILVSVHRHKHRMGYKYNTLLMHATSYILKTKGP